MGEVGIKGEHLSSPKISHGNGACGVFGVLADLEDDPSLFVVCAPNSSLVLNTGSSSLGREVYAPTVGGGGGELLDNSPLDEGGECLFEYGSCNTGLNRGPLSLERDRRGNIDGRLAGHEGR